MKFTIFTILFLFSLNSYSQHPALKGDSWYVDLEGYELVFSYIDSGINTGRLYGFRNFSYELAIDDKGDLVTKKSRSGNGMCPLFVAKLNKTDAAEPPTEADLTSPTDIHLVHYWSDRKQKPVLFDVSFNLEKQLPIIKNKLNGRTYEATQIDDKALESLDMKLELNNRTDWRGCYVGDSKLRVIDWHRLVIENSTNSINRK